MSWRKRLKVHHTTTSPQLFDGSVEPSLAGQQAAEKNGAPWFACKHCAHSRRHHDFNCPRHGPKPCKCLFHDHCPCWLRSPSYEGIEGSSHSQKHQLIEGIEGSSHSSDTYSPDVIEEGCVSFILEVNLIDGTDRLVPK